MYDPQDVPPLKQSELPGKSAGGGHGPTSRARRDSVRRADLLEVVRQGQPVDHVNCNCASVTLQEMEEEDALALAQLNRELEEAGRQLIRDLRELEAQEEVAHLKKLLDSAYNKVAELESERERQQNEGDLTPRAALLRDAEATICGARNDQYGDPEDNFADIAAFWSTYKGIDFSPHDVAAMMVMTKVARMRRSPAQRDHWLDIAGYAAGGWECLENGLRRGREEETDD